MLNFTAFLHRRELRRVIRRWLHNSLEPEDGRKVKELVNFNSIWANRVLRSLTEELLTRIFSSSVQAKKVRTKGELKDLLCSSPPYVNNRILSLIEQYRTHPEQYFRETPFSGALYYREGAEGKEYIGSSRIKRSKRIAEKGARRIIDFVYKQIKMRADLLAAERATRLGIPKNELITPQGEMIHEFDRAERRLGTELKSGRMLDDEEFGIHDVAGLKVITEREMRSKVAAVVSSHPRLTLKEEEEHSGRYNAVNFIVSYTPDKWSVLRRPLSEDAIQRLARRGFDPNSVQEEFKNFVLSGETEINIEIILSTYQEALESEVGRSMHEERVFRQRLTRQYRGTLSRNVSYLMEYLFAFAVSPQKTVGTLPFNLWIRYMPDYFDEVIKRLFNVPSYREIE